MTRSTLAISTHFKRIQIFSQVLSTKRWFMNMNSAGEPNKAVYRNISTKMDLLQSAKDFLTQQREQDLQSLQKNDLHYTRIIQAQAKIRSLLLNMASQYWKTDTMKDETTIHFHSQSNIPLSSHRPEKRPPRAIHTNTNIIQAVYTADQLAHLHLDYYSNRTLSKPFTNTQHVSKYFNVLNNVLHGWMIVAHMGPDHAQRAHQLLQRMLALYQLSPECKDLEVDTFSFSLCIQAFAQSNIMTPEPAIQAYHTLQQMEQLHQSGKLKRVVPNIWVYNNCIHAFAKRGMVDEAEALLFQLENNYLHHKKLNPITNNLEILKNQSTIVRINNNDSIHSSLVFPDAVSYSMCIDACAKSRDVKHNLEVLTTRTGIISREQHAKRILHRMIQLYEITKDERFRPTHVTFGTVIAMFSKSNDPKAPIVAHAFLQTLIQLSERQDAMFHKEDLTIKMKHFYSLQPNAIMFASVMSSYNRQKIKDADEKVPQLLGQMEHLYEAGNKNVKPSYQCFVMCLDAYAKSKKRDSAEKAEAILTRLETLFSQGKLKELNRVAYNSVIEAWGRKYDNKEAVHRAQGILLRMKIFYDRTHNPAFLPDKYTYSGIMSAWLYRNDAMVDTKCMKLLEEMKDEYNRGNHLLKPDNFVYSQVINAFAISGKPFQAHSLLSEMEQSWKQFDDAPAPSIECYNGVIKAFAKSDVPDRALHALRILEDVKCNKVHVRPNMITYSSCIDALARSSQPDRVEKAEKIFGELLNAYQESRKEELKPSPDTWSLLLLTHAYSDLKDKINRAVQVIDRMKSCQITPNTVHYTTILLACTFESKNGENREFTRQVIYQILSAFDQREQHGLKPEYKTFVNFLSCSQVFDNQQEKDEWVKEIFERCKQACLVDSRVIDLIQRAASKELLRQLLSNNDGEKPFNIPPEWSREVKITHRSNDRREERKSPRYNKTI